MSGSPHEGGPQSKQQRVKKASVFSRCWNRTLLPQSRASAGSHYECAWSSPEAERTWRFICLPSSDHTSQSASPALDDDRREMQPADWPSEAPLHSAEQGRGSGERGGVGVFCSTSEERKPTDGGCVWVCDQIQILGRSVDSPSVLFFLIFFYSIARESVLLLILAAPHSCHRKINTPATHSKPRTKILKANQSNQTEKQINLTLTSSSFIMGKGDSFLFSPPNG